MSPDPDRRRRTPTWVAVTSGLALGFAAASAGKFAWNRYGRKSAQAAGPARDVAALVDLFRLPSGAHREMFLVPSGPDANGEPALAASLFPGEEPPRELASLLVANVSADEPWTIDLESSPLTCRRSGAVTWETLHGIDPGAAKLDPAAMLRLRGLGGAPTRITLEPRTLRRVLMALPPKCRIEDLSDVQWGTTPLVRDQLDLERVRRFREDPAAVTTGR